MPFTTYLLTHLSLSYIGFLIFPLWINMYFPESMNYVLPMWLEWLETWLY